MRDGNVKCYSEVLLTLHLLLKDVWISLLSPCFSMALNPDPPFKTIERSMSIRMQGALYTLHLLWSSAGNVVWPPWKLLERTEQQEGRWGWGEPSGHGNTWILCQTALLSSSLPPALK